MRIPFFVEQLFSWTVVVGLVLLITGIDLNEWAVIMHGGIKGEKYMIVGANLLLWSGAGFLIFLNIMSIREYVEDNDIRIFSLFGR